MSFSWCKETYERSLSSRCWNYTAYDAGWEKSRWGPGIEPDDELRQIVEMELALGELPASMEEVVKTVMNHPPPCGHSTFPEPYLLLLNAIGTGERPALIHTCYTVDPARKRALRDYCLCLDAWLAGAPPESPAKELAALGSRKIDWPTACADLWQVLGEHTELKDLLIERVLLQTRWWIKTMVWDDDRADQFGHDQYLGDYEENANWATDNGNRVLRAPMFNLHASPRVQRLDARLEELLGADWPWFRDVIGPWSWPCALKALRYFERLLWAIGNGQPFKLPSYPDYPPAEVPPFLQAEDTCPDPAQAAAWWQDYLSSLRSWWQELPAAGPLAEDVHRRLGEFTPVKCWLVRLLVRRLEIHALDAEVGRLVAQPRGNFWGKRPV